MAAIIKAYREFWDEMLAVGLGVVVTDVAGNTVKGFVGPWLEKVGLAQWADPISEFAIGTALIAVSEMLIPATSKYKVYGRLAAFGATAVAVADTIAIAMGMFTPTPARPAAPVTQMQVVPRQTTPPTPQVVTPRPAVVIPPPTAPAAAPAAVTVMPRPATSTPTPAKAPQIFGS
jgi:hypothetical protein